MTQKNKSTLIRRFKDFYSTFTNATFKSDGLITVHNSDFLADPLFLSSYALGEQTGSWMGASIQWRAYIACWAADRAKHLEGDFVECGVNRGGLARTVMNYVSFDKMSDRKFYLLDTYCGIPEIYQDNVENVDSYGYTDCYQAVLDTFKGFSNAIVVKGIVPETLSAIKSEKVAYLSIDMNSAEPEIATAEFLWDKLVSGAAVVLDDYNYGDAYILQKKAFDKFADERNVTVLSLPTGQGLIIKP